MSELQGKNIIQQGLVLHLDSGNPQSFDGNSTIWRDLSGNGNNGTLVNGVSYSNSNRGVMVFDGTNDNATISNTVYNPGTTGDLTLDVWVSVTGPISTYQGNPLGGIFGQGYFGLYNGYGIGIGSISGTTLTLNFQTRNGMTVVEPRSIINLNIWYNVIGTFNRTTNLSNLYINGTLSTSLSIASLSGLTINPSVTPFMIGANTFPFYTGCKFATGRVYNRALSQDEITYNFESTRNRFGI